MKAALSTLGETQGSQTALSTVGGRLKAALSTVDDRLKAVRLPCPQWVAG